MPSRAHRNVIGVGGILEYGDGIVLVRLNYSRHKGLFMFPGGKVEPGETLQGALVREVEEETGLVATPRRVVAVRHRVDQGELNTYLVFAMRYVREELRLARTSLKMTVLHRKTTLSCLASRPWIDSAKTRRPSRMKTVNQGTVAVNKLQYEEVH